MGSEAVRPTDVLRATSFEEILLTGRLRRGELRALPEVLLVVNVVVAVSAKTACPAVAPTVAVALVERGDADACGGLPLVLVGVDCGSILILLMSAGDRGPLMLAGALRGCAG